MLFDNIKSISSIYFTTRELDVISCISNTRGVKKTAIILSISHRTVEGYIQNILLKISGNSQEQIRDFVEQSKETNEINERYSDLLVVKILEEQIYKISNSMNNAQKVCVYGKRTEVIDFFCKIH